jgi:Type ISP C-terminal specificity domain/N-6 DNA Methylase
LDTPNPLFSILHVHMLAAYLQKISDTTSQGDAREESHYGHLSGLLQNFAARLKKDNIQITTLPKKTEAGNPDFRIWDGQHHIVGYIEAKKPGENLDVAESSDQLKRYRSVFPNLILTDFYEFRLYRNGQPVDKVLIGRPFIAKKLKAVPPVENEEKFDNLFEEFFSFTFPKVFTAESLAEELAKRTRFLRDEVVTIELEEEQKGKGPLYGFYTAFKKYLIADLKEDGFADIYSQTITYGLFAARTRANGKFTRRLAYDLIPQTIGILRDVFQFISLGKLPLQMEVIIDDIAEVLQAAEVSNILHEYYRKGKGEDPIVHFYETFLNIYDPATREKRGVYYTPEPVVKYIVRAIHDILKTHFDLADGLASKEVTLLDPAGGTLTFPAEAIKLAVKEFTGKYGDGGLNPFLQNHILKNYFAFELMMAPYAIGHIKIAFLLEELGYTMKDDDRFNLFLTNTLDMEDLAQTEIPGLESLSDESHRAGRVKKNDPILVVLGNPPYSGHSANKNDWTEKLLKEDIDGASSYYKIDGEPLGEKNPKWLQDDYVKFLRFSQWKIHKAGHGIVGMITNHSYLDNPTFRGMRQSLMGTFNEIYIIDLHGNSLKKETTPEGGKDENVFDIRQGTSIFIGVKEKGKKGNKVFASDLFGLREEKYEWLAETKFSKKNYEMAKPEKPFYFLKKDYTQNIKAFLSWVPVQEIFPVNSVGVVTARDEFAIDIDKNGLEQRIRQFKNLKFDVAFLKEAYQLKSTGSWKLEDARERLAHDANWEDAFAKILYRPFDDRSIFYHPSVIERERREVMQHMLKDNLALAIGRQGQVVGDEYPWNLAFITDTLIDFNLFYRGGELLFPLYLYKPQESKRRSLTLMLFEPEVPYGNAGRTPNINKKIWEKLEAIYKKKFTPENLMHYIYGIIYSPVYREKFAEFLKIDFPRIPFATDFKLFLEMAEWGKQLTELHLLKHKFLNKPLAKYHGKGDDQVDKVKYDPQSQRVAINDKNYFDGISPEVWNYQIGGYQVMDKYLKPRVGRLMADPAHFCKMATAIARTIEIQKQIDPLFKRIEKRTNEQ